MSVPKLNLESDDFLSTKRRSNQFIRSASHGDVLGSSPLRRSARVSIRTDDESSKDDGNMSKSNSNTSNTSTSNSNSNSRNANNNGINNNSSGRRQECDLAQASNTILTSISASPSKRHRNLDPLNGYDKPRRRNTNNIVIDSDMSPISPRDAMSYRHTLTNSMSIQLSKSMVNIPYVKMSRSNGGSPVLSPRAITPTLSPRNNPKSPRTVTGNIHTSYTDAINYIRRRSSGHNSPRPAEITAFCCNGEPICLFFPGRTKKEIGRELQKHQKIWRHLLKAAGYTHLDRLEPELVYEYLNDLEITCNKGTVLNAKQSEPKRQYYSFQNFQLNEIKENIKEKRYVVLIKNGEVQEVLDCDDPDLLVLNFKQCYHRYVPIYRWFQENNYQDFVIKSPRNDLYHTVLEMGAHKLYGYIENTMVSAKNYVKLKTCPVY